MEIHSLDSIFMEFPTISMSEMIHILYLDRIDSLHFNYGDAWYEGVNQPSFNEMIGAQG